MTTTLTLSTSSRAAISKVEIESLRRRELEEAERILCEAVDRPLQRAEVGLAHTQRPRQQEVIEAPVVRLRARTPPRNLVPPRLDAGRSAHAYRDSDRSDVPLAGVRSLGSTLIPRGETRASVPLVADSSRARAR
jgi:hypothetical protein